jgi:hypothetical protein
MAWTNSDGLLVRFGTERSADAKVAEYTTDGPGRLLELHVPSGDYPLIADGSVVQSYEVKVPAGAFIESVEIVATTDVVSATGTVNVGLAPVDGSTADVDALVVAATATEINTGGSNVAGWVGAAVGATLAKTSHVTLEVDTDEVDSGEFTVRVVYSVPVAGADTLIQS